MSRFLLIAILVGLFANSARSEQPAADQVLKETGVRNGLRVVVGAGDVAPLVQATAATGITGGLLVEVGTRDTNLLSAAAKTGAWVPVGLPTDAATAVKVRKDLAGAGLLGQAAILDPVPGGGLPFADNSVALLVVDFDALATAKVKAPAAADIQRVLRPLGAAWVRQGGAWKAQVKPFPKEMDGWQQFHYDGGANDHSKDTLVGPARGLQWSTGTSRQPLAIGVRVVGSTLLMYDKPEDRKPAQVVARDAFSGVRLWTADYSPTNRFLFLADDKRLYLHTEQSKAMLALDLATGKQMVSYDQGFQVEPKEFTGQKSWTVPCPQARLADGVLLQTWNDTIWALDAASGKLLWKQSPADGFKPYWPAVAGGLVVVAEGDGVRVGNAYIDSFHRGYMKRLVARDLKTGAERWRWNWDGQGTAEVSHICIAEGRIGISLLAVDGFRGTSTVLNGKGYVLNLDLATGKKQWLSDAQTDAGLGGHGFFRTSIFDGKQWVVKMGEPRGFGLADGKADPKNLWSLRYRCHPARTAGDLLFSSMAATSLVDDRYQFNIASRASCDLGTFPADGLLYQTAVTCGCQAFLSGNNAYHSQEPPKEPAVGERLVKGSAAPAPVPTGGEWPLATDWPMHLRDARRSMWSAARISPTAKIAWSVKPEGAAASITTPAEWLASPFRSGPVSAASVAEGVAVVALVDQQQVVGLDPASGNERWRTAVDGRVDSAPTIYRGVVLLGTRTGWVYALNRDTGAVVWRFYAPPQNRTIVAYGQAESAWPLFGTVSIVDGTAWVAAGRELMTDGGFWWWGLDPLTGAVKAKAHTGFDGSWQHTKDIPPKGSDGSLGRFSCAASPPISDGRNLFMQQFGLDLAKGTMIRAPENMGSSYKPESPRFVIPGMFGLLNTGNLSAGRHGPMALYASVPAKFHAVHDPDFVSLFSGDPHTGGRENFGDGRIIRWKRRDTKGGDATKGGSWVDKAWEVKPTNRTMGDYQALAVAGDTVAVTIGSELQLYGYEDGKPRGTVKLPARAVFGGLAAAGDGLFVTCSDGTVVCVR